MHPLIRELKQLGQLAFTPLLTIGLALGPSAVMSYKRSQIKAEEDKVFLAEILAINSGLRSMMSEQVACDDALRVEVDAKLDKFRDTNH
jgi:hypothetical protein